MEVFEVGTRREKCITYRMERTLKLLALRRLFLRGVMGRKNTH